MEKQEKRSLAACIASTTIFGFSFLFTKICLQYVTPVVLLGLRYTLAFAACNLMLLTGRFRLKLRGKPVRPLLLLAVLQPVCYAILETMGVNLTGAFFSGLMIALIPIASTFAATLTLGEKTSGFQVACSLLSVVGVILTAFGGEVGSFHLIGFLCLLGSVVSAAFYNILNRKTSADFTPFERIYVMFGMGMAVYLPAALFMSRGDILESVLRPLANVPLITGLLFLGIISSVLAFILMSYAATYLPVARSAVFVNLTTVISILAGVLILREAVTWVQLVGSAVILLGVYGVNRPPKKLEDVTSASGKRAA